MSLLSKGANRLSGLEIDADKDWVGRPIKNLGPAVDNNDALVKSQGILQSLMTGRGDIIYRGSSEAVRLGASYGAGYNFLHLKNAGQVELEWLDIQDLISYLTGAKNRLATPPALQVPNVTPVLTAAGDHSGGGFMNTKNLQPPQPSLAINTNEDHSGGGQQAVPALNVPVPAVAVDAQLV